MSGEKRIRGKINMVESCPTDKWDVETDVVVAGYGAAGAAAAIVAHEAGAEVLLLEKMANGGGNTALSGGIVYGGNTSVQRAKGISDSAEAVYKYYIAVDEGMVHDERIRVISEQITCGRHRDYRLDILDLSGEW